MSVPLFQRSPRPFPSIPTDEVEIQAPPPIPTRPTSSLVAVVLPIGFTVLALGLSVALVANNSDSSYLFLSLPLMLGSALVGVINYSSERRRYRNSLNEREQLYHAHLAERRSELVRLAQQQRTASLLMYPDYEGCLAIARRESREAASHLWERSSGLERARDEDFLHLRVGTGRRASTFRVKPPASQAQVGQADKLHEEALRLASEFRDVDGVAIPLPLTRVGSAGVVGPRAAVLDSTRALLVQLATLHAPSEVKIVVLLPQRELHELDWVRWLPHVWDNERKRRFIATTPDEARELLATLHPILQKRAIERAQDDAHHDHPAYVFLFADPGLYEAQADSAGVGPVMRLLLTQGAKMDAYGIFLNERAERLPAACRAIVDLSGGGSRLRFLGPPPEEIPFVPDRVDANRADTFARALAPVRLKGLATESDLPSSVPLTRLLKVDRLEDYPIANLWQERDTWQRLEVPLGVDSSGGTVFLNFQETACQGDGSHAMVGGTTGTGKTRFLQTMIALLAAHHHPHDVNFFLIDYKGGDLLKGLEDLPHVVGTLANLEKRDAQAALIERLFVCLEAELRRRRNLLGGRNINEHQRDYLQGKCPEPLPHLFIVIDEFAEMIRNSPDKAAMTKRLLSLGATGRSLGVHLVLATQDPSGVVSDELRTNINTRLCLRMGSREASMDILKLPDAYDKISGTQVGRIYLQVGNNDRSVPFQVAWGGDPYAPGRPAAATGHIFEVRLDGKRVPLRALRSVQDTTSETQMSALVRHIQKVADDQGIQRLKSPWTPPLPPIVFLEDLRQGEPGWNGHGWDAPQADLRLAPIIGRLDDPANQAQGPLRLPLGDEGHFALYGEPGSGKTTFVHTLVTSLALSYSPDDVHLYLIDFSGQRLLTLGGFPHVGDVFPGDDVDRVRRLFRYLAGELQSRKEQFARAGVAKLSDFRTATGTMLPAVVVVLEDYGTFYKTCQDRGLDLDDRLANLIRDGGSYGLHFVLTLTSPSEMKMRIANSVSMAATYHLATPDYGMAVGPTQGAVPPPVSGRGLFKGTPPLEFQTALPVRGNTEAERSRALKALMDQLSQAWQGRRPRAFAPVPAVVGLSQIVVPSDRWVDGDSSELAARFALSLDDPDTPFWVPIAHGPYFLVCGTPESGKTTLLQSWVLSLAERRSPSHLLIYLVDFRKGGRVSLGALAALPHVSAPFAQPKGRRGGVREGYVTSRESFLRAMEEIGEFMQKRRAAVEEARRRSGAAFDLRHWLSAQPTVLMALDDFEIFDADMQASGAHPLGERLKEWRDLGFALIVAGGANEMGNRWGWIEQVRNVPVGFQVGTAEYTQVFKLNLPADNLSKHLPPGEGFYIRKGQYQRVKIADPQAGPVKLAGWVERLKRESGGGITDAL